VISYNPPGLGCFKQRNGGWQGIKEGRALLQNHAAMYTGDDGPDAMKGMVFQHFQGREKGVPLNLIKLLCSIF
jgi:hypothetical protein